MLLWCAIYRGEPRPNATACGEATPRWQVLKRFDDAARLGMHDGRAVEGMWLIDKATERGDVVRVYGQVPDVIRRRHEAYLAITTARD